MLTVRTCALLASVLRVWRLVRCAKKGCDALAISNRRMCLHLISAAPWGDYLMRGLLKSGTATLAILVAATSAMAQDSQDDDDEIEFAVEEITVTAQKRESTLLETPIAITAIGGQEIDRAQTRDIRDIQTLVPTLQVAQFAAASNTSFSIRGVGSSTFNFGIEPAVGVFVDGVYRSRNGASISDFLGLERVEVLRGPQSTLFGKNTTAGVINFVTKAPGYEWGVEGELTYGEFNAFIAKIGVEGPLIEDVMAFRVDAYSNTRDGFLRDVVQDRDVNERNRWGIRAQNLFEPTEYITIRTIFDYNNIDEACCAAPFSLISPAAAPVFDALGIIRSDPADPFSGVTAIDGSVLSELQSWGFSTQLDWEFDTFVFTSQTAWRNYDEVQDIDPDFTSAPLNRRRVLNQNYDTFTQEVRFTSTTDGPIDWLVGGYYFNQRLFANNRTIQGPLLRPFGDLLTGGAISLLEGALGAPAGSFRAPGSGLQRGAFDQNNELYALFAQVDWHVTDKLTVTGGFRYTEDSRNVGSDIQIDDPFAAINILDFSTEAYIGEAIGLIDPIFGLPAAITGPIQAEFNQALAATGDLAQAFAAADAFTRGNITNNPALNPLLGLAGLQFFPPAPNINANRTDDDIQGNIIVSYDATETLYLYASFTSGFKAGGFALDPAAARVGDFTFDPETADAWEIGFKTRLFNNRLAMNVAVFTQTVNDFQANVFTGTSFVPDNAGSIDLSGLEFDGTWAPIDGLFITGAFAWLFEREYGEFLNGPCPADASARPAACELQVGPTGATNFVQDLSGQEVSGTNEFRGSLTATYTWNIGDDWQAFIRGEYAYQTGTFLTTELDPRLFQDAFGLGAASIGFGPQDGSWELQFWTRNLFDEQYLQGAFNSTVPGGNLNAYPGDPFTFGGTLRFNF